MAVSENDLSFPSGTHALSSRESVIQRQMLLSEEQYTNAKNFRLEFFLQIIKFISYIYLSLVFILAHGMSMANQPCLLLMIG